jgi:hypothetical protein
VSAGALTFENLQQRTSALVELGLLNIFYDRICGVQRFGLFSSLQNRLILQNTFYDRTRDVQLLMRERLLGLIRELVEMSLQKTFYDRTRDVQRLMRGLQRLQRSIQHHRVEIERERRETKGGREKLLTARTPSRQRCLGEAKEGGEGEGEVVVLVVVVEEACERWQARVGLRVWHS